MALRDRKLFVALFKRNGAIDTFHNPDYRRNFVITNGRYVTKKMTVQLTRFLLPAYRVYTDDQQLIDKVYDQLDLRNQPANRFDTSKIHDTNIRRLFLEEGSILSDQAHNELEQISKLPESQREPAQNLWTNKLISQPASATPAEKLPEFNVKPADIETPQQVKNIASGLKIFIFRNFTKYLATSTVTSLLQNGVNAVVGGGGQTVLNGGRSALNTGENLLTNFSRLDSFTGKFTVFSKTGIIVIIALLLGLTFFIGGAGGPGTQTGTLSADLSSCKFTRGDRKPPAASYQSPLLLSYFSQAEQKTTVPAALLAAIARVESPGSVSLTDDQIKNYSCPKSSTGALGIMQIQPPETKGYFKDGVELGASFIGKSVADLVEADFCNPSTNIIMSAGFILKKLEFGYKKGDGTKWDPTWSSDREMIRRVAESYYGCLNYGSAEDCVGPYNYADDLWNSLQSCQSILTTKIPPASPDKEILHNELIDAFGISMDTKFDYSYLLWAWEKLWSINNTRFMKLVSPSRETIRIRRSDKNYNQQVNCTTIDFSGTSSATGQPYPETLFKIVFIHELAHIIQNCNLKNSSVDKLPEIITQEGYATSFSGSSDVCVPGDIKLNEDYAETIAYYLNPTLPETAYYSSAACPAPKNNLNPFDPQRNKPLHLKFVQDLLGTYSPSTAPTAPASTTQDIASCPVDGNPALWIPSFQKDPIKGHCGEEYTSHGLQYQCDGNTRRGKSMDILTEGPNGKGVNGKDVTLPLINNQSLNWKFLATYPLNNEDCFPEELLDNGCGIMTVFKADLGEGKNWVVHLLHIFSTDLKAGNTYPSGTVVGKTAPIHVHVTIGKDIKDPTTLDQNDPGWIPADVGMKMCL